MQRPTDGIALVTVLLIMAVVGVLVFGTAFTTQIELRITRNDITYTQANYAAQTGLEKYKTALFQNFRWARESVHTGGAGSAAACLNRLTSGLDFDRNGVVEAWGADNRIVFGPETVYETDGVTEVGRYTVTIFRDVGVNDYYTVRSVGESNGARATVEAVLEIASGGILANAVFAGRGGGNAKFNGGATIRGGVYIFGEGDEYDGTPGDDDANVFNSNGNFAVYNDYDLTDHDYDDVRDHVTSVNWKAGQLCASFRIADGQLDVGSNAVSLGSKDNPLLGVYVDDGVDDIHMNGNKDVTDSCKKNGGVCANVVGAFDLDDPQRLPVLGTDEDVSTLVDDPLCSSDPEYWETCIRQEANPGGLTSGFGYDDESFQECIDEHLTMIDGTPTLVFGDDDINCTATVMIDGVMRTYGFSYDKDSSPARFQQYGDLVFSDIDVRFAEDVEYEVTGYEDGEVVHNAALSVLQSDGSSVGGNLRTEADFLPDPDSGAWPGQVLAIIAEDEVRQRGSHMMALVYAGYRFRTEGQNVLYGQVITDEFCTTSAGQDACNAGQSSEVVYLNPADNSPRHFQNISPAGGADTFRVLSYNLR